MLLLLPVWQEIGPIRGTHATPTSLVRPSFSPRRRSNNTIEMGPQSCLKTRTTNPVMVWRREGGEKRGRKGGWGGGRVMTKRGDSDDDDDTVMAAAAAAAATARKWCGGERNNPHPPHTKSIYSLRTLVAGLQQPCRHSTPRSSSSSSSPVPATNEGPSLVPSYKIEDQGDDGAIQL